ncbi:hypothetical protein B0H13DRAFT_2313777 [Mycena leptocephala]|nr:hypothetical protein B0H13DRAFT_2313777 [Mycena leptocephala]
MTLGPFLSLMENLSHPEAAFELDCFDAMAVNLPSALPPIRSTISSFLLALNSQHSVENLGYALDSLIFPHLRELRFRNSNFRRVMPWPVTQFESLSSRSSFQNTLRILEFSGITITEEELVRSVVSLTSLERLVISDQPADNLNHILITDYLLVRLTRNPDTPVLCPQLKYLGCTSFCRFSAEVLFDFVASRVVPGKGPFQSVIRRLGGASVEFEPQTFQKLQELVQKGDLRFCLE